MKDKEQEVEQLSEQVKALQTKLEETKQVQKCKLIASEEKAKCLASEKEQVQAELANEKTSKAIQEVQLQNVSKELCVEASFLHWEVATTKEFVEEKELELEEWRRKNVFLNKKLRDQEKIGSKLQGTSEAL